MNKISKEDQWYIGGPPKIIKRFIGQKCIGYSEDFSRTAFRADVEFSDGSKETWHYWTGGGVSEEWRQRAIHPAYPV